MRKILFRGKRACGKNAKIGQWVTGCLWHHADNLSVIYSDEIDDSAWVSSETLGQFTGLTDKNGKKIFEGDIVKNGDYTMVVVWYDFHAAFMMASRVDGYYYEAITNSNILLEVIGNIHDNPELLGSTDNGQRDDQK